MAAKISMFIKRNKPFFIALAIAIGTALSYAVINAVLAFFNLKLAEYVFYAIHIICVLCILFMLLYCIVVCIKQIWYSRWYPFGAFVTVCLLCAFLYLQILAITFGFDPVHIVKKGGQKYVADVTIFLSTRYINYYDYKNILICGKQVKIHEDFTDGSDDPLKADNPSDDLLSAYYYDDNGNVISSYDTGRHY